MAKLKTILASRTAVLAAALVTLLTVAAWRSMTSEPAPAPVPPPRPVDLVAQGLGTAFEVPEETYDRHGNPVSRWLDEKTGMPVEIRHKATGMHLKFIPAGKFMMGSNAGELNEKPIHPVTLTKPFYMGKYEVTQTEWQSVMGENPSQLKGENNPVENVSWDDCQEFIDKVNNGLPSPAGRGAGGEGGSYLRFSLPTEAQWEYACRAKTQTEWFWGDKEAMILKYANTDYKLEYLLWRWKKVYDDGFPRVAPVGQFRPNGFGLYDMAGNVWEWCQDWYDNGYYGKSPEADPTGPAAGGSYRVDRGGGWCVGAGFCRSASRYGASPGIRGNFLGCRALLRSNP